MLKVIQLLPELNSGGVERGTLEVARYLVENGHESIVVSNGGRQVPALEAAGSRHISRPIHRKRLSSLTQVRPLRALFEKERPDIVHVRSRAPAWLTYLAWRKMDPKTRPHLVSTVHGFNSVNAYSRIMTRGETVICVSESIRRYVCEHYPQVPSERLRVIPRGVDPAEYPYGFQPDPKWRAEWEAAFPQTLGKWVLCLPGRITQLKGHLDFIAVVDQLWARGIPVHGVIVGDAHPKRQKYFETVMAAAEAAGGSELFTFAGHRSDLREIMAISDVVLSCSTQAESFGRTTLEALAIGKPVAAYAHGGVEEQLDTLLPAGKVAVGDTAALTELLASWHPTPPHPARENPFTLQAMLEQTLQVYRELVD